MGLRFSQKSIATAAVVLASMSTGAMAKAQETEELFALCFALPGIDEQPLPEVAGLFVQDTGAVISGSVSSDEASQDDPIALFNYTRGATRSNCSLYFETPRHAMEQALSWTTLNEVTLEVEDAPWSEAGWGHSQVCHQGRFFVIRANPPIIEHLEGIGEIEVSYLDVGSC